jgi:glycosyltransferase involved in cell wall biosynthesis
MDRKRILYVSPNSLLGGGEINQMLLVSNVDKTAFDVEVVVGADGPYAQELRRRSIPVSVIPMAPIRVRSRKAPSPMAAFRLYRHARRTGADLLHSSSLPEDHHCAAAGIMAGVPVIHDAQTIVYQRMPFDRWRAASSARVICISRAIQSALARAGLPTHNTEIIYSGVDPRTSETADGMKVRKEFGLAGCDIIGIASRLSPEKGHEHFLRAAASVTGRFPNARFLVVGGPMYAPEGYDSFLKQLAQELGLARRVVFTGFRRDALDAIDATDVLVCAADEEALGRVVLEAMALGKPVIATNAGGPRETIEDGITGLLVPPKDFRSLAQAMTRLLSNMPNAREMGALGKQRAADLYTLGQNVEKVQQLYHEVLAQHATGGRR